MNSMSLSSEAASTGNMHVSLCGAEGRSWDVMKIRTE
jgi:hypothetical protein